MTTAQLLGSNPSTHAMLYRLFAAEVGLLPVESVASQFETLVNASATLKQAAISAVGSTVTMHLAKPDGSVVEAVIPGKDEAHLFLELYKNLELFTGGTAFADEYSQSVTLNQVVYPTAARAIEAQEALAHVVAEQMRAYVQNQPAAVRQRIDKDLHEKFRFSEDFILRCAPIK